MNLNLSQDPVLIGYQGPGTPGASFPLGKKKKKKNYCELGGPEVQPIPRPCSHSVICERGVIPPPGDSAILF